LPEQPIGDEVERGAVVRARAALPAKAAPEDLGIGIEAGLIRLSIDGRWVSAQVCALAATDGRVVVGLGPGYELPERLQAEVLGGEPLRPAFERLLGVTDPDRRGAVHHLSNGWIDRESLTREAVRMAFLSLRATPRPLRAS
jgi:inosine/xanthosine triphosphatase